MDNGIFGVSTLRCRLNGKKGQTVVEYALVLAFISVLSVMVLSALGVEIRGLYLPIIDALQAAQQSIQ
jgi:Flp pilus assembly pilin Flp